MSQVINFPTGKTTDQLLEEAKGKYKTIMLLGFQEDNQIAVVSNNTDLPELYLGLNAWRVTLDEMLVGVLDDNR